MSASPQLIGIGIIGKANDPIYMCDCLGLAEDKNGEETTATVSDDVYGFLSPSKIQGQSLVVQHQLIMHAALDQVDELVNMAQGESNARQFSGMPVRKKPNPSMGPHYLGVLLDLGENEWQVHGYITATNVKFMALTKNTTVGDGIRTLLESIHSLYISFAMNPFNEFRNLKSIESDSFDRGVRTAVQNFQNEVQQVAKD